jgi:hypothetical protein
VTTSVNLTCLDASRLPELYRKVCAHAGIPLPPTPATAERFVVRCGGEPPELFPELLEEAFAEDAGEVPVCLGVGPTSQGGTPAHVAIRPGFPSDCPSADELRAAVVPPGPALLFAIERRDAEDRLLGVTWAATPEEEPPPECPFRAAVLRQDLDEAVS